MEQAKSPTVLVAGSAQRQPARLEALSMSKAQSETRSQRPGLTANKRREDRDRSQEKMLPGDHSASNYSAVQLHLGGLRNDEVTDDSLVTETDLNTLNTGKIAAVVAEKDFQDRQRAAQAAAARLAEGTEVIDEKEEQEEDPEI